MVDGRLDRGLIVEILKGQPDLVGAGGLEVAAGEAVAGLALAAGEVGWVLQPHYRLFFSSGRLFTSSRAPYRPHR